MKTLLVVDDLAQYPRTRGPADNQKNILARRSPAVPEILKRRDEICIRTIHPLQLIKEYNFLGKVTRRNDLLQRVKRLVPVL